MSDLSQFAHGVASLFVLTIRYSPTEVSLNKAGPHKLRDLWHDATMAESLGDSVYVVATSKGNMTVYWAAATKQAEAVTTVQQRIPPGWTAILTDRRLTPDQVASLRLRPGGVRQLKFGGIFGGKEVSQRRT
jgi:hypothetical protein